MTFDKDDNESPFLSFVAREFIQRKTPQRVALGDKRQAQQMVRDLRLAGQAILVPRQSAPLSDITTLTEADLGERCVLKYLHGWSARGVMPLERTGPDEYFDHLALRRRTLASICAVQEKAAESFAPLPREWAIEEFLTSAQPGEIPFDYKFYVFQRQIGLIVQIDRNTNPPKLMLFDGNLQPLHDEKDFQRDRSRSQRGVHLLPQHVVPLSRWALFLAQQTDSPFVSIDLYDSLNGPAFGEFTFSPGATYKRMVRFSHALIEHFDNLFDQAEQELQGQRVEYADSWSQCLLTNDEVVKSFRPISTDRYSRLASFQYNGGVRAAVRTLEMLQGRYQDTQNNDKKVLLSYLINSNKAIEQGFKERAYG